MRKLLFILIPIVLILTVLGTVYVYFNGSEQETKQPTQMEQRRSNEEAKSMVKNSYEEETSEGELSTYEKKSESSILQEIHNMTHQKVAASEKWGYVEITEDRVNKLVSVVEKSNFETKQMLLEILKPWQEGDFSNSVEAHNQIWRTQNGTIGKATRLLTPEEESYYIEEHFR